MAGEGSSPAGEGRGLLCASRVGTRWRGEGVLQPAIGSAQVGEALLCASQVRVRQAVAADDRERRRT